MNLKSRKVVAVIGAGLAGSEAAWQIAERGFRVRLYEMRPKVKTPAHQSSGLAELVCSNSFRSAELKNAVGLLKEEMRVLDSLVLSAADQHALPAGGALAIDREGFSAAVTRAITGHPNIELIRQEVVGLQKVRRDAALLLIATGPLTSPALSEEIRKLTGSEHLYFYDSIAPIISAESINQEVAFRASRWDKGTADYLNCPLNREQYYALVKELVAAEKVPTKDFEKAKFFEACLPIEVMAERGPDVLSFGPMKPVGLCDPHSGKRPFAVVQLRQDDLHASLYNMVGFQTRMKYPEQKRIFRMIPGLELAEFVRLGSMHRNTFINAPQLLNEALELRDHPGIYLAGQMIGVEGYVESAAMGLYAGIGMARRLKGEEDSVPPAVTAMGALIRHLTKSNSRDFQPMNVNFGLFEIPESLRKKDRRMDLARLALEEIGRFKLGHEETGRWPVSRRPTGASLQ